MESIWVIGLMSGTSLDGIDAAYIKTDGVQVEEFGLGLTVPYEPAFGQLCLTCCKTLCLQTERH